MKHYLRISKNPEIYLVNFPKKTNEVFFDIVSKAGKIFEVERNLSGAGHIFEHYVIGSFYEKYDIKPAYLNGENSEEKISFTLECEKDELFSCLDKLMGEIFKPDFLCKSVFGRELKAAINEISERKNILGYRTSKLMLKEIFSNCPYVVSQLNLDNLKNIGLDEIKKYQKEFFSIKPTFFFGGYNLSEKFVDKTVEIIKKYFQPADSKTYGFEKYNLASIGAKTLYDDGIFEGVYSSFVFPGYRVLKNNINKRIGLNILRKIMLSDPEFGLLHRIREKGVYSLEIDNRMKQGMGFFSINSFCDDSQVENLITTIKKYLKNVKNNPIDGKTLNKIITKIKKGQEEEWEDNYKFYDWIMNDIVTMDYVADKKVYSEILSKIDVKFLKTIAKEVFNEKYLSLFYIKGAKGGDKA